MLKNAESTTPSVKPASDFVPVLLSPGISYLSFKHLRETLSLRRLRKINDSEKETFVDWQDYGGES